MTHPPLDPFSILAIAFALGALALSKARRHRELAHRARLFRSIADVGANTRGGR